MKYKEKRGVILIKIKTSEGEETHVEEEITTLEKEPVEVAKPSRKKLYAGISVILIVLAFLSLYWYSSQVTSGAIEQVRETVELTGYQITDITILPPSARVTYSFLIHNPTDYSVTISVEVDFYLDNGTFSQRIGEIDAKDLSLPAGSTKTIELNAQFDYITLTMFESDAPKTLRGVGTIQGSVTYLFFTFYQTENVDKTESI